MLNHFRPVQTLCDPMTCSSPGSSVHGILQARTLEWVAMSSPRGSSDSGIESMSLAALASQADYLPLSHQEAPELPYDLAIPLLGISGKNSKSLFWKDTCTPNVHSSIITIANI